MWYMPREPGDGGWVKMAFLNDWMTMTHWKFKIRYFSELKTSENVLDSIELNNIKNNTPNIIHFLKHFNIIVENMN